MCCLYKYAVIDVRLSTVFQPETCMMHDVSVISVGVMLLREFYCVED